MKQVDFRRFRFACLPMALLLALLMAQALEPATAAGLTGAHSSGVQRAPWFNQAQNLQQQLSPVTGDMKKLEAAPSLSMSGNDMGGAGGNPGLGTKRPGAHGGNMPWANQAQQLQSRLAGGGSTPWANQAQQLQGRLAGGGSMGSSSMGGSMSSLSGASNSDSLASVPPPSAGGGISNPYAGGISVTSLGSAVPGANSPYTSTGNAAGLKPYGQALRFGFSGAE